MRSRLVALWLAALLIPTWIAASEQTWWKQYEVSTSDVNEGTLDFLSEPPEEAVHHHRNHITVGPKSLETGWVHMTQCHSALDPVPRAQVVYNRERMRQLTVTRAEDIERAWVEGHSVQLEGVGRDAKLCVQAELRALRSDSEGGYSLHSGPFMRRFLDGYYPMHVTMNVEWPGDHLRFVAIEPRQQAGFEVCHRASGLRFEAWFEGKLRTRIRFEPVL